MPIFVLLQVTTLKEVVLMQHVPVVLKEQLLVKIQQFQQLVKLVIIYKVLHVLKLQQEQQIQMTQHQPHVYLDFIYLVQNA